MVVKSAQTISFLDPAVERLPASGELSCDAPAKLSDLLRQLGTHAGLWACFAAPPPPCKTHPSHDVGRFLEDYQTQLLAPLEIPVIIRARSLAEKGFARELIALDRDLTCALPWPAFASASRQVGRAQLERLRPLRDHRPLQRYLAAVHAGDASGWHSVVYGLTLAVYSLPLRHALLAYARQTLTGLALALAGDKLFHESSCQETLQILTNRIPAVIEQALADGCGSVQSVIKSP